MRSAGTQSEHRGIYTELSTLIQARVLAQPRKRGATKARATAMDGAHTSHKRGRGMTFSEVRPYQAGDDIRSIDWRVTARTQETYTKLFEEEKERPVYLLVDQRSPMFFGSQTQFKSCLAAEIAATLAWATLYDHDSLAALIFGDIDQNDFRPSKGKRAILRFLNTLTDFNHRLGIAKPAQRYPEVNEGVSSPQTLSGMLRELRRVARPGAQIYIISDFHDFDSDCERSLSLIARHCDIEVVHISDSLERELPEKARLNITDGHRHAILNTFDKALVERYREDWQNHQALLSRALDTKGILVKYFYTELPIHDQVSLLFSNRPSTLSSNGGAVSR